MRTRLKRGWKVVSAIIIVLSALTAILVNGHMIAGWLTRPALPRITAPAPGDVSRCVSLTAVGVLPPGTVPRVVVYSEAGARYYVLHEPMAQVRDERHWALPIHVGAAGPDDAGSAYTISLAAVDASWDRRNHERYRPIGRRPGLAGTPWGSHGKRLDSVRVTRTGAADRCGS